jgi:predicted outer membrane repeat protein
MRRAFLSMVVVLAAAPVAAQTIIHVPNTVPTLQAAFLAVPDGGVIELAAGTYTAPAGGHRLNNIGKGFTVRPAGGGPVVLSGNNQTDILRFQNTSFGASGPIVFEDLTIERGRSSTAGIAAGITVYEAEVSFVRCLFRLNVSTASTVGGALYLAESSRAVIVDSVFEDNTSTAGGAGIGIRTDVSAWVSGCTFRRNRADVPNHDPSSGGGGINVGNSDLQVADTLFEDNSAGGFGGGLYVIGSWQQPYTNPRSDVVVSNCEFVDNIAERDPSVTGSHPPTEGGAINAEDQTRLRVFGSTFENNRAMIGGGVNGYRSTIEIVDSAFYGNRATDTSSPSSGFGGAVKVTSDDGVPDGSNNRPTANLLIEGCFLHGQDFGTAANATVGGCLFAGGDGARIDGDPTVPDIGTIAENRAEVVVRSSILADCDTAGVFNQKGDGGAIYVTVTHLTLEDSLVIDSDARGHASGGGWAGGVMGIVHSDMDIVRTTLARNTAGQFGGALVVQGANLDMTDSAFFANQLDSLTYGGAMFSATDDGRGISATGTVADCLFADHAGITIFDDDRNTVGLPINDLHYNNNDFWAQSSGAPVYQSALSGAVNAAGLNSLVINRVAGLPDTDKGFGNTDLGSAPRAAELVAAPLDAGPAGSPTAPLGWAATGASAFLDGSPVSPTGTTDGAPGSHSLVVGSASDSEVVGTRPQPTVVFTATPLNVQPGGTTTLAWQVLDGTFEGGAIDRGVGALAAAVGSVEVTPVDSATYRLVAVTREGAVEAEVDVTVGGNLIFADGFEDQTTNAWSAVLP